MKSLTISFLDKSLDKTRKKIDVSKIELEDDDSLETEVLFIANF
jgi:hypothetical protein